MIYGHDRTWHHTQQIDVEVHNGKVVAVWFRCMPLPFRQSDCGEARAKEMESLYSSEHGPQNSLVNAVDIEVLNGGQ